MERTLKVVKNRISKQVNSCIYDEYHNCIVLVRLLTEFAGNEHRSLIFGDLLPEYCKTCPYLKKLGD